MEWRNYIRPIIFGLIGLGLVLLVIVLLVRAFSSPESAPQTEVKLADYAGTSATSTLVMQGPEVLEQNFRQVKITIGQNQNEIDLIEGYEGRVIRTQTYQSNSAAYGTFLQALQRQGFTEGSNTDTEGYRGVCPFNSRYIYGFNDGSTNQFTYWSTSCGSQGTFKGNASNVRRLFVNQIPNTDFSKFLSGTGISY